MTDTSWTSTSSMGYDGPSNWSNGVPIVTNNGIFGIGPPNPIKTVVVSGGTDHAGMLIPLTQVPLDVVSEAERA